MLSLAPRSPNPGVGRSPGPWRRTTRRVHGIGRALHHDGVHLVPDPVFILSPVRSGSTLLRSMLDTHREICAPHELHLHTLRVSSARPYAIDSWRALGLTPSDLENMAWDRMLHHALVTSGKRVVVDKTPQNAANWERIHSFWPQARYLHLRRHPGSIYSSMLAATPRRTPAQHVEALGNYVRWLDAARAALPGPTLRYEDLTTDPEGTMRVACAYLDVRYQRRLHRYRPTSTRAGLGDWSRNIRSGRVQPYRPPPPDEQLPAEVAGFVAHWGYA